MKTTIILCSLLTSTLLLQACNKPQEQTPPPRPALVMTVAHVTSNHAGLVLIGEVKSRYESNQSFRLAGKIVKRLVEVGDVVKKGQVLAKIDAVDNQLSAQAANADVLAARANYDLAKTEVERQRKLVQQKFISQSALDLQEAQLKTAAASLKQAQAQAAVAVNQSRYTTLYADRVGVVTRIKAEPGQVVQAGEMIAQIVDMKQIEVLAALPESKAEGVQLGDEVAIKLWANQAKLYKGKVREITPAASETTRAFDMRVSVVDADAQVKLGMTAGVLFATHASNLIMLPSAAVTKSNGKHIVWVIDEHGIANQRAVTIGPFTEYGIQIKSGLAAGEMVAIAGVHTLIPGQKVKPIVQDKQRG